MDKNNIQIPETDIQEKEQTSKELIANVIPEDGGIENSPRKDRRKNSGGRIIFEFNNKTIKY